MDIELYKAQIAAYFPQLMLHSVILICGGWDALVLDINVEFIFRFPRRPAGISQLEKEIRLLPALAAALPVDVPSYDFIAPGAPLFAGYPKIQGQPLVDRMVASPKIITGLARFLAALHTFPAERARDLLTPGGRQYSTWRQEYQVGYERVLAEIFPLLEAPARERERWQWESFLEDERNFAFRPVLIHGDLGPEHILCDPLSETLAGVIDWGDSSIGDPALDFAGLFLAGGQTLVEHVLIEYQLPVDSSLMTRMRFYTHIVPIHEIFFGLETGDEPHLQHGLQQLNHPLTEMENQHD